MITKALGVHQSDVVIRTALVQAISDLRANPWLLDHVFASLPQDELTAKTYGEKQVEMAKSWFLRTDIPVVMDYRLDYVEGSCISVSLVESVEAENTLGDVHYEPTEEAEADWPPLTLSFTPEAYDGVTGRLTVPTSIGDELLITTGMVIVDRSGGVHSILDVEDRYNFLIAPGTNVDFTSSVIKGATPRLVKMLESLCFKETYRIGVHAHGEPFLLTWLHSIMVFCLLRYKQDLLEGRGFERSVISSTPFAKDERFGKENWWSRYLSITGYVRHYWPKLKNDKIWSASLSPLNLSKVGETATEFIPEDGFEADDSPWLAQDGVGTIIE